MFCPAVSFARRFYFFLILLAMAGLPALPEARADSVIHVFLVGGQSNADGRADPAGLPTSLQSPQSDVRFYSNYSGGLTTLRTRTGPPAQFGPEITFGRSMADYYATQGSSVAILKYAAGGTNLYSQWAAGGDATKTGDGSIYQNFQNTITSGLTALQTANPGFTIRIDGIIWMQGESDAVATYSTQYQANLTAFIGDIRQTYGASLPFVIGELSSAQTGTGTASYRNDVRAAQVAVDALVANTGLVNTDSFGLNPDNLHFSAAGQQSLGYAFASSMQGLLAVPEPSSTSLLGGAVFLTFLVVSLRKMAAQRATVFLPADHLQCR